MSCGQERLRMRSSTGLTVLRLRDATQETYMNGQHGRLIKAGWQQKMPQGRAELHISTV